MHCSPEVNSRCGAEGGVELSVSEGRSDRRKAVEDRLAAPMFWLALAFLVVVAAATHLARASEETTWDWLPLRIVLGVLLLLWPVFSVEAVVRFFLGPPDCRTWKTWGRCLAVGLLPPLRMAAHSRTRPDHLWLPWMGWRKIDFDLQKTLERIFSGPMFFMALLILPVLAIEYFWSDAVAAYAPLRTGLRIGIGFIWIAFATEFVIRISVAEKKLGYAFNHWVDLAVVLLPMVEFMPFLRVLRVTRLMRLERLARIAKYYRLYGLAGKGWRGLVVLQMIQRLMSRSPKARLSRLKGQLEDKQEEIHELEREADYYRRRIRTAEEEMAEKELADPREADA